uniref:Cytochrome b5 heme-binding domain-containing protein n=1 Tax=Kalanchoe fedtschenkoi TaxID=63787 RepID=A0A7N0V323_KALFE
MGSGRPTFTFEEVVKHSSVNDCWIVIHGKVYDVTSFLTEHPGGEEIILGCTGRDATKEFEESDHSDEAKKQTEEFCIGEIHSASSVPIQPYLITTANLGLNPDERYGFAPPKVLRHLLLLFVALGVAFGSRIYIKAHQDPVTV